MKKEIFPILGVCSLFFCAHAQAQTAPTVLNVKPEAATIYMNGANLKRSSKVNLSAGTTTFRFINLPGNTENENIYAAIDGEARIVSVNSGISDQYKGEARRLEKAILDSIRDLQNVLNQIKYENTAYNQEIELLRLNMDLKGDNGVNVAELQKAADYYRIRLKEVYKLLFDNDLRNARLSQEISDMSTRYGKVDEEINKNNKYTDVVVKAAKAMSSDLNLFYFVREAAWSPTYNLRYEGVENPMKIEFNSIITNYSGENWSNIKVTLSTADPMRRLVINEFTPWYLGFEIVQLYNQNKKMKSEAPASYSYQNSVSNDISREDRAGYFDNVSLEASSKMVSQISTTYDLKDMLSLTKENPSATLEVNTNLVTPSYKHKIHVFEGSDVYLMALLTKWEELNLMFAPAYIFNKGEFVGKGEINPFRVNDTLEIALGLDKNVIVKRKTIKDFCDKNFLGNKISHEFMYEIMLKNTNAKAIHLELIEQVPVATNEEIEISVNESSNAKYDKASGKLTWSIDALPNEGVSKKFGFTVKYPKDRKVNLQRYKML